MQKRLPPPYAHLIGICLPSRAPKAMWKVAPPAEDELDQQPILWECGALHHLILIGPGDSVTDLRHKLLDGQTGHPESILQSGVAVTSGEISEGYCQLYSWTHWISRQGSVPLELGSDSLLQLLTEVRRHLIGALASVCCNDPLVEALPGLAKALTYIFCVFSV